MPRAPQARALAKVLELSLPRLLGLDESDLLTDEERVLLDMFRQADDIGKKTIAQIASIQAERPKEATGG